MTKIINPLASKVQKAIMQHDSFKDRFKIDVLEENDVVTLRGDVSTEKLSKLAESIAENVEGVSSVINQIAVDPLMKEEDELDIDEAAKMPPNQDPLKNIKKH